MYVYATKKAYFFLQENGKFIVEAGSLGFSVSLYTICAVLAIILLMVRRYLPFMGQAELGGPVGGKYSSGLFLLMLWLIYVLLSSLQAYDIIQSPI